MYIVTVELILIQQKIAMVLQRFLFTNVHQIMLESHILSGINGGYAREVFHARFLLSPMDARVTK